jgi:hypothetical protein
MTQTQLEILRKEVIQWVFRTKRSSVPIVGPTSASPLRNKSSFKPRAILMSPSAVPHADRQGRQSGMEMVVTATGSHAKCFLPYAPSAAKTPKCLLSLSMTGQSIVAIATVKSGWVDNAGLTMDIHGPGIRGPCMFLECDVFAITFTFTTSKRKCYTNTGLTDDTKNADSVIGDWRQQSLSDEYGL